MNHLAFFRSRHQGKGVLHLQLLSGSCRMVTSIRELKACIRLAPPLYGRQTSAPHSWKLNCGQPYYNHGVTRVLPVPGIDVPRANRRHWTATAHALRSNRFLEYCNRTPWSIFRFPEHFAFVHLASDSINHRECVIFSVEDGHCPMLSMQL